MSVRPSATIFLLHDIFLLFLLLLLIRINEKIRHRIHFPPYNVFLIFPSVFLLLCKRYIFFSKYFPSPPKNIISFSKYPFLPLLFLFLCKKIFSFFQIFSFFSTSTKRCFPSPNISPFSLSVFILLREKTHVFTFSIFHLIHRPHIFLLSKYFALFPSPFFFSSSDLKS